MDELGELQGGWGLLEGLVLSSVHILVMGKGEKGQRRRGRCELPCEKRVARKRRQSKSYEP